MSLVLLVLHLLIALALVGLVLTQRSEGGALGMGGGAGSLISGRGAADMLARLTMGAGAIFFLTSIVLSVTSRSERGAASVVDRAPVSALEAPAAPVAGDGAAATPEAGAVVPGPAEAVQRAGPLTERPDGEPLLLPQPQEPAPQRAQPAAPAPRPEAQRTVAQRTEAQRTEAQRPPPRSVSAPAPARPPAPVAEAPPESVEPAPAPPPRQRAGPEE